MVMTRPEAIYLAAHFSPTLPGLGGGGGGGIGAVSPPPFTTLISGGMYKRGQERDHHL